MHTAPRPPTALLLEGAKTYGSTFQARCGPILSPTCFSYNFCQLALLTAEVLTITRFNKSTCFVSFLQLHPTYIHDGAEAAICVKLSTPVCSSWALLCT